jgi:hypothetical protein
MSSAGDLSALESEFHYCKDRVALLRARLYRRGVAESPRLEELQRRLAGAEGRLRAARAQRRSALPPAR